MTEQAPLCRLWYRRLTSRDIDHASNGCGDNRCGSIWFVARCTPIAKQCAVPHLRQADGELAHPDATWHASQVRRLCVEPVRSREHSDSGSVLPSERTALRPCWTSGAPGHVLQVWVGVPAE